MKIQAKLVNFSHGVERVRDSKGATDRSVQTHAAAEQCGVKRSTAAKRSPA
ncbi:MAG: hypothetical protein PW786_02010 [Arachidicoccus sp.]|nr:hypothetical protein [Arachidicoccus sp.]